MSKPAAARIAIVYYSMYGHVNTLAHSIAKGVRATGAQASLFQVPETIPPELLKTIKAPPKDASVPVIEDPSKLNEYDGVLFGSGTRFGMMSSQLKGFFDKSGGIWAKGGWVGKPAGFFFSTAALGGGQETTALTTLTQFVHHGMVIVPLGYTHPGLNNNTEVHGGSPYGAGTIANSDGSRQPSELELSVAEHQGTTFAKFAADLKLGRAASSKL